MAKNMNDRKMMWILFKT